MLVKYEGQLSFIDGEIACRANVPISQSPRFDRRDDKDDNEMMGLV